MARAERVTEALVEHQGALRAFVQARVPPTEVDDVLKTAALRAIQASNSLNDAQRVRAWLYRIHRNVIHDSMRARARGERLTSPDLDAIPHDLPETETDICACSLNQMQHVRPSYASILALVDAGGASLREAAEQLGISIENATVRLHRARKALHKLMLEHCGVQSVRDCLDCRCADERCCPV